MDKHLAYRKKRDRRQSKDFRVYGKVRRRVKSEVRKQRRWKRDLDGN